MPKIGDFEPLVQYVKNKLPQTGFFSTLDEMIKAAPFEKAPADQWKSYLQPGKVIDREGVKFPLKKEELEYSGLQDWFNSLDDKNSSAPVLKQNLQDMVQKQRPGFYTTIGVRGTPQIEVSRQNGSRSSRQDPRFQEYSYAGEGDPYEESLTQSHDFGAYPTHWTSNVLSHSRATTLEQPISGDTSGVSLGEPVNKKLVRLIEEIQSDRHQKASEKIGRSVGGSDELTDPKRFETSRIGYRTPEDEVELQKLQEKMNDWGPDRSAVVTPEETSRWNDLRNMVPDAPFKDPADYGTLEMKKQLLNAVNQNADYLALTRGQDQINRYGNLGDDEAGQKGMQYIYDQVYPSALKKLAARYGAGVKDINIPVEDKTIGELPSLQGMGMDFPSFLRDSGDMLFDDPETGVATIKEVASDLAERLPHRSAHFSQLENSIHRLEGNLQSNTEYDPMKDWGNIQNRLESLHDEWQSSLGSATTDKSFPAIELTPDLKALIKKVGVPLWGAAGAATLGAGAPDSSQADPDTPSFAEGGPVSNQQTALEKLSALSRKLGVTSDVPRHLLSGFQQAVYTQPLSGDSSTDLGHWTPGSINQVMALLHGGSGSWQDRVATSEQRARGQMGLSAPRGIAEHAADVGGNMLGQLPIPGSALDEIGVKIAPYFSKAVREMPTDFVAPAIEKTKGALSRAVQASKAVAGSIPEWLFPRVEPTAGNYLLGTAAGTGITSLSDKDTPEAGGTAHAFAEGGKVTAIETALKALERVLQGQGTTPEGIQDMYHGMRSVVGAKPETRENLNILKGKQALASEVGDAGATNQISDDMLNHLAEAYLGPNTIPKYAETIPDKELARLSSLYVTPSKQVAPLTDAIWTDSPNSLPGE